MLLSALNPPNSSLQFGSSVRKYRPWLRPLVCSVVGSALALYGFQRHDKALQDNFTASSVRKTELQRATSRIYVKPYKPITVTEFMQPASIRAPQLAIKNPDWARAYDKKTNELLRSERAIYIPTNPDWADDFRTGQLFNNAAAQRDELNFSERFGIGTTTLACVAIMQTLLSILPLRKKRAAL